MALGSTQPLTEMSPRCFPWGKGGRCVRLTLSPSCAVMKYGNLNFLEPSGPLQACDGTVYCFFLVFPRQQRLCKSASMLRVYVHFRSCYYYARGIWYAFMLVLPFASEHFPFINVVSSHSTRRTWSKVVSCNGCAEVPIVKFEVLTAGTLKIADCGKWCLAVRHKLGSD
jgi:hypothetical protein